MYSTLGKPLVNDPHDLKVSLPRDLLPWESLAVKPNVERKVLGEVYPKTAPDPRVLWLATQSARRDRYDVEGKKLLSEYKKKHPDFFVDVRVLAQRKEGQAISADQIKQLNNFLKSSGLGVGFFVEPKSGETVLAFGGSRNLSEMKATVDIAFGTHPETYKEKFDAAQKVYERVSKFCKENGLKLPHITGFSFGGTLAQSIRTTEPYQTVVTFGSIGAERAIKSIKQSTPPDSGNRINIRFREDILVNSVAAILPSAFVGETINLSAEELKDPIIRELIDSLKERVKASGFNPLKLLQGTLNWSSQAIHDLHHQLYDTLSKKPDFLSISGVFGE